VISKRFSLLHRDDERLTVDGISPYFLVNLSQWTCKYLSMPNDLLFLLHSFLCAFFIDGAIYVDYVPGHSHSNREKEFKV